MNMIMYASYVCVYARMHIWVFVCLYTHTYTHTNTHIPACMRAWLYVGVWMCICVYVYVCVWVCAYVCICMYAGLDLRREKWFTNFLLLRRNGDTLWQSDSQLQIIIRNVFAFLHYKMCLKREKFCLKKWYKDKKMANHFAKVIRNQPKSDSHLAVRYRLFPALHVRI